MSVLEAGSEQDEYVRSLVVGLIESLVDGDVTVSIATSDAFASLEVRASAEVMSVLIGPKGQMAQALRTLLAGSDANSAAGMRLT